MSHRIRSETMRPIFWLGGVLLLLAALFAATHQPIQAQRSGTVPVGLGGVNTVLNTAPFAWAEPATLSANEGGTSTVTRLRGSDSDGDDFFFILTKAPQHGSLNGFPNESTAFTDATAELTVTYSHNGTENFGDTFEFIVRDENGEGSNTVTVSVTIDPVNDNPPVANSGSETVAEGGSVEITLTGSDPDGGNLTFSIDTAPSHGSLGPVDNSANQSATVTYTHNNSETLSDNFKFVASDGVFTSTAATISLTITPVNDNPPTADDGSATVNEGASVEITLTGSDADGNNLTFAIDTGPRNGSLGSVSNRPGQTATVTYTHDGSETTSDAFTFTVDDGKTTSAPAATVTITIDPVNDRPVARDDLAAVDEDSGFATIDVLNNDSDAEDDPITVTAVTQPDNGTARVGDGGQNVQYRPDADYCNNPPGDSRDTFSYTVNGGSQARVGMRVNCTDDPVVANDRNFLVEPDQPLTIDTLLYVDDPDGDVDPGSVEVSNGPDNGEAVVNASSGKITYTPDPGYIGSDGFDYTVCDEDESCDTGRFSLFVSVVDLRLTKDDRGVTVRPGLVLTYTLTYTNAGNAAATGVVISETVPANTVFDSAASRGNWSCNSDAAAGTTCRQNLGRIEVGTGGSTVFGVRLLEPLQEPAGEIVNRASIAGNNANGPELTPDDNLAEVRTPIDTGIDFNAVKIDLLSVDADEDGLPSPGDTLHYSITMTVTGNAPAANVVFSDPLDPATTLITSSVTTSAGTILPNDAAVEIALGDLPLGTVVTIGYDVRIRNPLPAGVTQIENQGVISGSNFPAAMTDDPDTPQPADPTVSFLQAEADLTLLKAVGLAVDADANGLASPGDTLAYTMTLINAGNQAVAGLRVIDALDANTTMVAGSLASGRGTIVSGNNAGDARVEVEIGTLSGGGDAVRITFRTRIKDSIAGNVDEIVNQAVAVSDSLPDVLSDDLAFAGTEDPTRITVNANAKLFASMQDFFVADVDDNGVLSQGDLLFYRVEIFNNGNRNATELLFENTFDASLELLPGTLGVSSGTMLSGNGDGDDQVRVSVGSLPGGGKMLISYQVRIGETEGLTAVSNQGTLRYLNNADPVQTVTDDPATALQQDPTKSPVGDRTLPRNRLFLPFVVKR